MSARSWRGYPIEASSVSPTSAPRVANSWHIKARRMRGQEASRAELLAEIDRPALKPLAREPYAFAVWNRCRVAPDYHLEVDGHWFSAPFRLINVDVRVVPTRRLRFFSRSNASPAKPSGEPPRPRHRRWAHAESHRRLVASAHRRLRRDGWPPRPPHCEAIMTAPNTASGAGIRALTRIYARRG